MQEFVVPRSMPRILLMMCVVGESVEVDDFGGSSLARSVPARLDDFQCVGYQRITKLSPVLSASGIGWNVPVVALLPMALGILSQALGTLSHRDEVVVIQQRVNEGGPGFFRRAEFLQSFETGSQFFHTWDRGEECLESSADEGFICGLI